MKNITDSTCTAQNRNGDFCDAPSYPDMPFPICSKHALEVWRRVTGHLEARGDDGLTRVRALKSYLDDSEAKRKARTRPNENPRVYYVQIGNCIKIGATKNLHQRLKDYGPTRKLLANEVGGFDLERRRHQQFARFLVAGREWYRPGPELIAHINELRKPNGAPPIDIAPVA